MAVIYKITSPTKKVYVGSTQYFKHRMSCYKRLKCEKQIRLYRSFVKYGVAKHKFEVICHCSKEEMFTLENYYGHLYNCLDKNFGLNCVLPKAGTTFNSRTEETRLKISKNNTGRVVSDETKNKIRVANIGKVSAMKGINFQTSESKLKMSVSHTGKKLTENHKNNIRLKHKGVKPKNFSMIKEMQNKAVIQPDYGIIFNSRTEAALFFNVSQSLISMMVLGKRSNKFNLY